MHHIVVQIQLPVIILLATRWCRVHMKLRVMNPFSNQLAEVVRCLMRLHLAITTVNICPIVVVVMENITPSHTMLQNWTIKLRILFYLQKHFNFIYRVPKRKIKNSQIYGSNQTITHTKNINID